MYPALLQSLPQRNLHPPPRAEAASAHKSHSFTPASNPLHSQHQVQAPSIGPEATSRGSWKELWAIRSSLNPGNPRKVLSESLLLDLEAAAVYTDGHCLPHGVDSAVNWKPLTLWSSGGEQAAQN